MEFTVADPAFKAQRLSVKTAGLFSGPKVLVNGVPVEPVKRQYVVRDDHGNKVALRLKVNLADPVPVVVLGERTIRLARPLRWYEYAWIGLPILLVLAGGALGGALGAAATYMNSHVLRSSRSVGMKYLLTGAISLTAAALFVVIVSLIQPTLITDIGT